MAARIRTLRHIAALTGAALGLIVPAGAVRAETWIPHEDDSLLLELRSGQYRLGEPMRGYQTPGGVCVDLGDLIQALDLPVRLDKKARRATGWLFAEDQRFTIDREAGSAQAMNGNRIIPRDAIQDTPEGWCVDLKVLSGWMGVGLRADLSNLAVVLESERKLPFLEAIERKARAARLRQPRFAEFDLARMAQAAVPYRDWRRPSIDLQLQGQAASAGGNRLEFEALAAGEVMALSYNARLAGSSDGLDALRLRLFRNDPGAQLLGPFKATQVALGDVEAPRGALAAQTAIGRGAFIANRPLNRPGRFGVTTVSGTMPAGWDAELYRNGELRAYQADRGDGRYQFDDIELLWGENDFEVVLYGPQGQIKRERSSTPVGTASLPPGKTWYWAGLVDAGRDLVEFAKRPLDPRAGLRWGVGVERGLDRRTTAGLEYHSVILAGRRRHYIEGSTQRALGGMLLELSGAQQVGAGRAIQAKALGRLGGIRYDAEALWINGLFDSELVEPDQRRHYGLRLTATAKLGSWNLPVETALRSQVARTGARASEWLVRSALQLHRTSLTLELSGRNGAGPVRAVRGLDAGTRLNLIANTAAGPVRLRGTAGIALGGGQRRGLDTIQAVAEGNIGERSSLRLGYEHDASAHRHELMLGWVRQFDRFALRTDGRVDTRGRLSLGVTLGLSLGPDPVDGGWRLSRERLAESGQAVIEVFRDDNGDGLRQADEGLLDGVSASAGFRRTDVPTNQRGRAVIDGLTPYVPVLVSIDTGTLPDPLLQPKGAGLVVVPRPGVPATVSLPLAPTGEVEALLLGPDGEPCEGLGLELTDLAGRVLRKVQSDFDGYALFDAVPYGDYRLRLDAASAQARGVRAELGEALRIDRANPSIRLGRIRLQPQVGTKVAAAP